MLTDAKVRAAKAAEKPYKLTDSHGLHLAISKAGTRVWRLKYHFGGKEKLLTIGAYPEISLVEARRKRDEAKGQIREGKDPSVQKKLAKIAGNTAADNMFEGLAREWHGLQKSHWTAHHAKDVMDSFEKHVFKHLGTIPISEINVPAVVGILRRIEKTAPETARRVRQRISAVFEYAAGLGLVEKDPAHIARRSLAPMRKGKQPAITELEPLRKVLADAEAVPAHPVTRLALRLLALTAVRPGELRGAEWSEFSLVGCVPVWEVPAERMKMKVAHAVPLSRQAVDVLEVLHALTGKGRLVFPTTRQPNKPLSENAIGYLLNRAGYHGRHVPHGFRASFSTIMNERFRADRSVIDLMLAHAPKDEVEGAYNRALHAERRRELAQEWADILLEGTISAIDLVGLAKR